MVTPIRLNAKDYDVLTSNAAATNSANMQTAIAAAKSGKNSLLVPAGNYNHKGIIFDRDVPIIGEGMNSTSFTYTGNSGSGEHSSCAASSTTLCVPTAAFLVDYFVGKILKNLTDGSEGIITSNSTTDILCSGGFTGGTNNYWEDEDEYEIKVAGVQVGDPTYRATQNQKEGWYLRDLTLVGSGNLDAGLLLCNNHGDSFSNLQVRGCTRSNAKGVLLTGSADTFGETAPSAVVGCFYNQFENCYIVDNYDGLYFDGKDATGKANSTVFHGGAIRSNSNENVVFGNCGMNTIDSAALESDGSSVRSVRWSEDSLGCVVTKCLFEIISGSDYPHGPWLIEDGASNATLLNNHYSSYWAEIDPQRDMSGTHNGSSGQTTVMSDSTADFVVDSLIGKILYNDTDGSKGTVTSNTATTITCSAGLSGGTDNDWDASDAYTINAYIADQASTSFVLEHRAQVGNVSHIMVEDVFADEIHPKSPTSDLDFKPGPSRDVRFLDDSGTVIAQSGNLFGFGGFRFKPSALFYIPGGTTGNRPTTQASYACYFDSTLGHPIWHDGTNWVDATGTTV